MIFVDIIEKKKNKLPLTDEEIQFWIDGVTDGTIPDYQTSALLMAIVLNGMNEDETAKLADAMKNSGDTMDLFDIEGIKADKHSTGGVGDKTSMALGAMVASCGLKVAKMSGRGLGHTGGTLDKLESIDGYNCYLTEDQFKAQVRKIGISIIGQTGEIDPADKKLYALRDVTATVDSIPLIASSIMSKKLVSGADTILLDVKYGEGAFMKTVEYARRLAKSMISIGENLGKNTVAMISDMNQPLGRAIGNAIEVEEAIDTVRGKGPEDFTELCLCAGEIMLMQGKIASNKDEARRMLLDSIESGRAYNKLLELVEAQGGNTEQIRDTSLLPQAKHQTVIKSRCSGYISEIHAMKLGLLAMHLGAGRQTKEDPVNHAVGLRLMAKRGDYVELDGGICTVYHDEELDSAWIEELYSAIEYTNEEPEHRPIVEEIIRK